MEEPLIFRKFILLNFTFMEENNHKNRGSITQIKKGDYEYTPKEGFIISHFLTVANIKQSADFYLQIFGGKVIRTLGAWDFAPNPLWYKMYAEIIPRVLDVMRSRGRAKTRQNLSA